MANYQDGNAGPSQLVVSQIGQLAEQLKLPPNEDLYWILRETAFKGSVTDSQLSALLIVAGQYGLNPWTREIYAFPDKGAIVPVVGVDGWSRIINSNPMFDGMDFKQDDESCTCTIYRKDRSHPIQVTEWMAECKREPRNGPGPWQSHPKRMLRHKAMIQCARLAFSYAGIYDPDEAERILEAVEEAPAARHNAPPADAPRVDELPYPPADFAAHSPDWVKAINKGKMTAQQVIDKVQVKGKLTEEQIRIIKDAEVIDVNVREQS